MNNLGWGGPETVHIGDEIFSEQCGFATIREITPDGVIAEYASDHYIGIPWFEFEHGKFASLKEAYEYPDWQWAYTPQYHDNLNHTEETGLYIRQALFIPNITEEPRVEIFRSELDMINFEGISLSLTDNRYIRYWRMDQPLRRGEWSVLMNILRSPAQDMIRGSFSTHWEFWVESWIAELCEFDDPMIGYLRSLPMPRYDFTTIN